MLKGKIRIKLVLILLAMSLLVKAEQAAAEMGKFVGVVIDARTGKPLSLATVQLSGGSLTENKQVATDVSGKYEFGDVPVGTYRLVISFVGYTMFSQRNIKVLAEKVTTVNAELEQEHITLESVVVTASKYPQKISKAPAAVSVIERRKIEGTVVTTPADLFKGVPGVDVTSNGSGGYAAINSSLSAAQKSGGRFSAR